MKLQKCDTYQNGVEFRHNHNGNDVKWPPSSFVYHRPWSQMVHIYKLRGDYDDCSNTNTDIAVVENPDGHNTDFVDALAEGVLDLDYEADALGFSALMMRKTM